MLGSHHNNRWTKISSCTVLLSLVLLSTTVYSSEKQINEQKTQSFMLGKSDINQADISYSNPLSGVSLNKKQTRALVKRLAQTRALNQDEINQQLKLQNTVKQGKGFSVANPYYPRSQDKSVPLPKVRNIVKEGEVIENPQGYDDPHEGYTKKEDGSVTFYQQAKVTRWFSQITHQAPQANEVCAVKFSDSKQENYQMRTFASQESALQAGWTISHQYQCGTCSTLRDLAVYIGIPNQTTPISACTRAARGDINKLDSLEECIVKAVGFTQMCAQTWAYNGIHTPMQCGTTCRSARNQPFVVDKATGKLNSCLWCDEKTSGPGFKYSAGRTRRGSGLESAIARPYDKLYFEADHSKYFTKK